MTPLIDLTFLLLITFIITFPMLEQGIPVKLPRGKANPIEQQKSQSITIDVTGKVHFNNRAVTLDELSAALQAEVERDPEGTTVLIRGDDSANYGKIVEVLRIVHQCKIARMAIVTEPSGGDK